MVTELHDGSNRSRRAGAVESGTIYAVLVRLQKRGWIRAEWGTPDNNRRAKFYSIAARGRKQLTQDAAYWRRLADVIGRVLSTPEEGESRSVVLSSYLCTFAPCSAGLNWTRTSTPNSTRTSKWRSRRTSGAGSRREKRGGARRDCIVHWRETAVSLLFGVEPGDPATFIATIALMTVSRRRLVMCRRGGRPASTLAALRTE